MVTLAVFLILETVTANSSSCIGNKTLVKGDAPCPPWQARNSTTRKCECMNPIHYVVVCTNNPYELQLHNCFCMTYNEQIFVGPCLYTCHAHSLRVTVDSTEELNKVMCGMFKRRGQMCAGCIHNHAPPVYSYSLSCVNCTTNNWGKFTAVSLLPLTAFFVLVATFRVKATSQTLHGFILFSQIITCSSNMRALEMTLPIRFTPTQKYLTQAFVSFLSVWNLDFFRLVYTPFCLRPHTTNLQVLALDYVPAVYPLLLIAFSYQLVRLYDQNVRFVVCLCKPFVSLFIRFRRQWNIRNSLLDAFATFLILSYVKILSVSVDLLMPVAVYDQSGQKLPQLYLFNQGDVAYFSTQHLPYACLALFFLLTFTLLPMTLLFLYPFSCFQVCLNRTGLSCQSLHIFMDSFQGHFKNGTNGTRDFRYFSALYLLLRGLVYASTVLAYQIDSYAYTTVVLIIFTVIVASVRPHKAHSYTINDTFFLVITAIVYMVILQLTFYRSSLTEAGIQPFVIIVPFAFVAAILAKCIRQCKLVCSKISVKMAAKVTSYSVAGYESLITS